MGEAPAGSISRAVEMIKNARHLVALTGAGISVPSGVPDFRSAETGLWQKNDPLSVATLSVFRQHPEQFFNWLRPLAKQMQTAQPNPAHRALAKLEESGRLQALITQNIDGLHQRAGSKNVIQVHGTAESMTCLTCQRSYSSSNFYQSFLEEMEMPRCPACGKIVKPDIVLFEEMLPRDAWERAASHAMKADLLLIIGSSLTVFPAADLPYYTLRNGGQLIINTFSATPLDAHAALLLRGDVAQVLPEILEAL